VIVDLLAALTPTLVDAVRTTSTKAYLLLDGTLLPIDRIAADRPFYSGNHKRHGMNVQVLADPFGRLLCASPALLGAVHVVRAAREHGIVDALSEADITCWADKGYRVPTARSVSRAGDAGSPLSPSAGGEPVPCEDPRTRRAGHDHAQVLTAPPQAPALDHPDHPSRPSRRHPASDQLRLMMVGPQWGVSVDSRTTWCTFFLPTGRP
jgi:hypothetical protein